MTERLPLASPSIGKEELAAVLKVLRSRWLVQGPRVAEFEASISRFTRIPHAVALSSCTSALYLCLRALGADAHDEVVVPAFTFVATANAVVHVGSVPVFADIDPATFNVSAASVASRLERDYARREGVLRNRRTGRRLRFLVVVHQFGLAAPMDELRGIARANGLEILEDAACALGTRYRNRHVGTFGVAGCLSFHPRKSITTGEGGMVLTRRAKLARTLRRLRDHGAGTSDHERHRLSSTDLPDYPVSGFNSRMTDLQAALGVVQMRRIASILRRRSMVARHYLRSLAGLSGVLLPRESGPCGHSWQSFVVRIPGGRPSRDRIAERLAEQGIATRPGTHAVPWLGAFRNRAAEEREGCPRSLEAERTSLALPLFADMGLHNADRVSAALRRALK